jgi:hypothetical protein
VGRVLRLPPFTASLISRRPQTIKMLTYKTQAVAVLVVTSLAFVSFRPIESRTISQLCSGWLPMDCRGIYGCKNCFDGIRLDCFPESNSTFVYGDHLPLAP